MLGLAAATSIKISPILLLVVAIAGRDWRTVARVAGIVFVLSVVAVGLYGWTPWAGFVAVLPSLAAGEAGGVNLSTGSAVGRFLRAPGVTPAFADGLAALSSLALIGWGLWVIARASKSARLERESFAVSLATMASSLVWYHSLTLLVPSIAVLLFQTPGRRFLPPAPCNRCPPRRQPLDNHRAQRPGIDPDRPRVGGPVCRAAAGSNDRFACGAVVGVAPCDVTPNRLVTTDRPPPR